MPDSGMNMGTVYTTSATKVLKPFQRDVSKRTRKTKELHKTKLFPNKKKMFWQQDGAKPHTAKTSKALIRKIFGNKWTDDWPANSPDLNLIENVWAIVDNRIRMKPLYTLKAMRRRVNAEWRNLGAGLLERLFADFHVRCQLVHSLGTSRSAIAAKGGAINR